MKKSVAFRINVVSLVVLGCLVGCGPMPSEESVEADPLVGESTSRTPLTPEELAALVASAEEAQDDTVSALACPASNSCSSSYGSCASWSSYTTCNTACFPLSLSCATCEDDPIHGPRCWYEGEYRMTHYRYQTCFNLYGDPCTKVEVTTSSYCGC